MIIDNHSRAVIREITRIIYEKPKLQSSPWNFAHRIFQSGLIWTNLDWLSSTKNTTISNEGTPDNNSVQNCPAKHSFSAFALMWHSRTMADNVIYATSVVAEFIFCPFFMLNDSALERRNVFAAIYSVPAIIFRGFSRRCGATSQVAHCIFFFLKYG